jgi:hypothetical protein
MPRTWARSNVGVRARWDTTGAAKGAQAAVMPGDAEDELRHRAPARRGRDRADGVSIAAIEHAAMVETAIGPAAAFLSSGRALFEP